VLHARPWQGHIVPSAIGSWRGQTPDGQVSSYTSPAAAIRETEQALHRYFRDEFPSLKPVIKHLVVLVNPDADVVAETHVAGASVVRRSELALKVNALVSGISGPILDPTTREALATALQERPFSRNQRATEPFIFQGGNALGTDRRAWTLQQVFNHMDRYPADGIYHMRNGTLEQWLTKQGAVYTAGLVKESLTSDSKDPRSALEKLLVKSGLANPRGISVRPRKLDFGVVLAGADQGLSFTLRPIARNGYLVATLESDANWLSIDTRTVMGTVGVVSARVDTTNLPIQVAPYDAQLLVTSPLLAAPLALPVRMRVVGEPSLLNRRFLRPLVGLVTAAIFGVVIGMAIGMWGMAPPLVLGSLVPSLSPLAIWGIIFGLFWAVWGLVRGLQQPLALSIGKALIRWLMSTTLWIIPLGLIAFSAAWALGRLYPMFIKNFPTMQITIVLTAVGLAIVPAVMDRGRNLPGNELSSRSRSRSRRPLVAVGTALVLALLVFGGVSFLPLFWQSGTLQTPKTSIINWATTQFDAMRAWMDHQTEQYFLKQYDHRAPELPTVAPSATVVKTLAP
ncbi:MAG: hypothetical protein ACYCZF_16690, partial [Anaerolineae bacterium]